MNIIKQFAIFKKDNKGNDKLPSYSLSAKVGEDYLEIGAGWVKDVKNGKFISIKLSDVWVNTKDETKSRKSYVIVCEEDLQALEQMATGGQNKPVERLIDPANGNDLTPSADDIF